MKSHKRTSGIDWVLKSGGICAIRGLNCCQREFWHRRQNDFLTDPCISIVSDSELNHTFDDKPQYWHSETTSTNQKVNLSARLCSVRVEMTSGKMNWTPKESLPPVYECVCDWPNADSGVVRHLGWSLSLEKRFTNAAHSICSPRWNTGERGANNSHQHIIFSILFFFFLPPAS